MLASAPRRCIPFIDVCVERSPLCTTSRDKFAQKTAGDKQRNKNRWARHRWRTVGAVWWGGKGRCRGSQLLVTKSHLFILFKLVCGRLLFLLTEYIKLATNTCSNGVFILIFEKKALCEWRRNEESPSILVDFDRWSSPPSTSSSSWSCLLYYRAVCRRYNISDFPM